MTIKRLYDSPEWRKARISFLDDNPLCAPCSTRGLTVPATVVHHTVPHKGDINIFWDRSKWESVCKTCHDSILRLKETHGFHNAADEKGMPIDPDHPWNKTKVV